jgi:hypothetical protein
MYKIEKFAYNLVRNNQRLKFRLVGLYQRVMSFFRVFTKDFDNPKVVTYPGFYGGFHDLSLESPCGRFVAALKIDNSLEDAENAEIALLDLKSEEWEIIAATKGFSWQMGAKLHWADERTLSYLDVEDDHHVSFLIDVFTKQKVKKPFPIVHCVNDLAVSYDFGQVERFMPGYGCGVSGEETVSKIKLFSLNSEVMWSLSVDDLLESFPISQDIEVSHFFHHALFNRSGNQLFFLHRYVDNSSRRYSRMFIVDIQNKYRLKLITGFKDMVSHITWASDTELIAYARDTDDVDGYYLLDVPSNKIISRLFDHHVADGHPTSIGNKLYISDTYPDRLRNQYLQIIARDTQLKIFQNHLPMESRGDLQIDLHPRFGTASGNIYFDTYRKGVLSFNVMKREVYENIVGDSKL